MQILWGKNSGSMEVKKKSRKKPGQDLVFVLGIVFVVIVSVYIMLNADKLLENESPKKEVTTTVAKSTREHQNEVIRKPAVAGSFYPNNKKQLEDIVGEYLNEAPYYGLYGIRGLVSPHAGYVYSGPIAAYGYKQLTNKSYRTVIILGPSHYVRFEGASIPNATSYETPLGLVKISPKAEEMMEEEIFVSNPQAHEKEHSIEVQIPFLQEVLAGDFTIIPIVTGEVDPRELAETLVKYVDGDTLVVASSDLSHYYTYEQAVGLDKKCVGSIPKLDFNGTGECEACGRTPILVLMYLAEKLGWSGRVLDYRNSGDTAGTKESVVGYTSIAFYSGLNKEEQEFLLKLSRNVLENYTKDGVIPKLGMSIPKKLKTMQGCFVTLNKNGNLRGCIGHIIPQKSLYDCVIENTVNAAVNDMRFEPVEEDELGDIEVEVSVLTAPEKLEFSTPDELLEKLVPLRDGVIIKYGSHQSTYLPQVWEKIEDKEEFLSSLCEKGGSHGDCWRNPGVEVYTYRAQVFHE